MTIAYLICAISDASSSEKGSFCKYSATADHSNTGGGMSLQQQLTSRCMHALVNGAILTVTFRTVWQRYHIIDSLISLSEGKYALKK